ncbi:Zinc finger protein 91 [Lucilia cuprina]|nr:Zinc finger protein 91 [Lucilia cuprina]
MSVDIIESITIPPLKRLRSSSIISSESTNSKCGEVFVTNCADKWTFYCSHCQLSTTDIGVFVCHIRLQHLNQQQTPAQETPKNDTSITIASSRQNVEVLTPTPPPPPPPMTFIPRDNIIVPEIVTSKGPETEQMQSDIVKEEPTVSTNESNMDYEAICSKVSKIVDISTLTQPESNNQTTADVTSDKNTITTTEYELDEEFIAETTEATVKEQIIHVVYQNDDNDNKEDTELDNIEKDYATDCSLTETEDESNEYRTRQSRNVASGSKVATVVRRKPHPSRALLPHKCPRCNLGFKSKQGVHFHITKIHDKNLHTQFPYKCTVCNRGFKSMQGLKYHNVNHDDQRKEYKCSMCPGKFYKLNTFITHVLTHENEKRFPCQVCGKFFDSNDERVRHWKQHAKDKPFGCSICYRRFPREQYLTHHLKSHNLYQCHFCPDDFTSKQTQHIPYVCPKCEQLPDIKEKVEHLRTLSSKNHVFESDEESIPIVKNEALGDQMVIEQQEQEEEQQQEEQQEQQQQETIQVFYIRDVSENNKDEEADKITLTTDDEEDEEDEDNDDDDNDDDYEGEDIDNILTEDQITSLKCTYCYKLFDDKTSVLNHINSIHLKDNVKNFPYTCKICKKGFKSRNGMKGHSRLHETNNQLKCPICPSTLDRTYFATHVLMHESETCFPCQVCGEIYDSHVQRLKHWYTHGNEQPYGCNYCFRRYKKEKYLLKHLECHKPLECSCCKKEFYSPDTQPRPPLICRNCINNPDMRKSVKILRKKYRLSVKEKSINLEYDEADSQEDDSDVEFVEDENKPSSSSLLYNKCRFLKPSLEIQFSKILYLYEFSKWGFFHANMENPTNPEDNTTNTLNEPSKPLPFQNVIFCDSDTQNIDKDSDESSDSDVEFVNILNRPDDSNLVKRSRREYKCCGRNFINNRNLNSHISREHSSNKKNFKFKCKYCKKFFQTRSGRVFHERTHDKKNKFQCPLCSNAEFRENVFLSHVMLHESDTCYPCQVCAQIFQTAEERLEHWHTHAKDKPYPCHICHRRFKKTFVLRNHKRLHGIYECQFCGDNFESSQTLRHPYVCGKCEKIPEIKKSVEHQRTLADNKHVFQSDEENPLVSDEASGEDIVKQQQNLEENLQVFVITNMAEDTNDKERENIKLTTDEDDEDDDDDDDGCEDNGDGNILTEEHITSLRCTYCHKLFDDKTAVLNHIKTNHLMNNIQSYPYTCTICKKGFKSKSGLKGHSSSHETNNQLQCPICLSKFYKTYFVTHVLMHESETCFPCQVCGEIYDSNEKRLDHWHTHEKDKPYGCNYCFRRYEKEKSLLKHLQLHKPVECSSCKTEFYATDTRPPFFCRPCMKEHVKELQTRYRPAEEEKSINSKEDEDKSQEDDSDAEFITDEILPSSSGSFYNKKIPEDSDTQTIDENSGELTDSDVEFVDVSHESNVSKASGAFICCGKNFHNYGNLNAHITRTHESNRNRKHRKHVCHLCKKSFKVRSSLVYHVRTHDINNQFECPICPYAEFRESDFLNHVITHESPTCYPCQVCAEIFHTQEERLEHWHTHADEKPCACHVCHRRFRKTFILVNHMRAHGIYQCQFCEESYESTVIQRHPYVCGKCEEEPEIKKTVDQQRTLPSNKRVFDGKQRINSIWEFEFLSQNNTNNPQRNSNYPLLPMIAIKQEPESTTNEEIRNAVDVNAEMDGFQSNNLNVTISRDDDNENTTQPQENSIRQLFPMPMAIKQESESIINEERNNTNETISQENEEEIRNDNINNDILKSQSEKRDKTLKDKQKVLQKNFKICRQKLSLKCGKCKRSFNTRRGLLIHLTTHNKKKPKDDVRNENIMNLRPRKSTMLAIDEVNKSLKEAQDNQQQLAVTDTVKPTNNENDKEVNDTNMKTCDSVNEEDEYKDDMPANQRNKGKKSSKFRNKLKQLEHMKRHRRGKNASVKCRECNKVFASINGLKAHLRFHLNLTCPMCEIETTPHLFIKHVLTHESDGCYPCQSCGKIFSNQEARMKHWHSHDKERPFACSVCYRRYGRIQHLRRHMKCHEQESNMAAAADHNNTTRDIQASQQQLGGKTPKKLKSPNKKDKLLNVSYINSFCSTNLEVDEGENLNFANYNEEKCPQCNKSFASISALNSHLVFHSNVHCPICKLEVTQNFFIKHILKHEGENCYPCQSCGKIFSNLEERMKHWHSHAQEKPFACTICFRRYGRLQHLSRHMRGHMEYDCNLCGKTFKSVAESAKPPHVCKKCKKSLKYIPLSGEWEKKAAEEADYKE